MQTIRCPAGSVDPGSRGVLPQPEVCSATLCTQTPWALGECVGRTLGVRQGCDTAGCLEIKSVGGCCVAGRRQRVLGPDHWPPGFPHSPVLGGASQVENN